MKRAIIVLALSAIGLFSLSCDGDNGGDGGAFSYPHPDGGRWTYDTDITTTAYEYAFQYQINGTYNHPTAGTVQRVDCYEYDPGTQHWDYYETYYLLVTDNEVRYYQGVTDYHEIMLKLPPSVGQEWNYHSDDTDYTAKVIAQEDVSVPAGSFNDCYKVEYSHQGSVLLNIWYAGGVGGFWGVQLEWRGYFSATLSSYNLPS